MSSQFSKEFLTIRRVHKLLDGHHLRIIISHLQENGIFIRIVSNGRFRGTSSTKDDFVCGGILDCI